MTSKCLVLVALATGCVVPEDGEDEELDVVESVLTCAPGEPYCAPDLVPVYMSAPDGRCNWDGYNLRFGVRNVGAGNARASQVRVSFSASTWPKTYTVPPLVDGQTYSLWIPDLRLDQNCVESQRCTVRVTVDSGATVAELSETNNSATRLCDFHF
ncbi:MAG: hypothetical protein M4D80_22580 [Myxococcota bacterium]|nr:hypothetical protein [Deltaproteobacteria bacterium]MDQ3337959.1 hypothetical protein [Myxococcota bacterium]